MIRRKYIEKVIPLVLCVYFFFTVIAPLIKMLLFVDISDAKIILLSQQMTAGLTNSIIVSLTAALLSVALALTLAWILTRTNVKCKNVFTIVMTLPMLIPSISHSTGLILLFGTNGFLTKLLGMKMNIYGFWGIVLGSIIYSFPFAFIMFSDILKYENYAPYEAADVFGIAKWRQVKDITFPYLRKPIIPIAFSTFTIIFTDYGIPISIGGKFKTLPVVMYQEVIGQLDFGKGSMIGLLLLIPALLSFFIDCLVKEKSTRSFTNLEYNIKKGTLRDGLGYVILICVSFFILLINVSFVLLAFTKKYPIDMSATWNHFLKTFEMNGVTYLFNSLIVSFLAAVIGTFIGFVTAYFTARMKSNLSKILHLTAIISLAIPGIVLGLSYVLMFKNTSVYGTIVLLVIVNITHFMASPYFMMYNTFGKINENLEAVGETLGINRLRIIKDIVLPQSKSTLLEMASYLFINSMVTISAVSFLAVTNNKVFSLMINQFDALMLVECSAVVSLILLVINMCCKAFIYLWKTNGL